MGELIVFPDPVITVMAGITERIAEVDTAVPVTGWIPHPRPAEFVRVLRSGGAVDGLVIDDAYVLVEAWAQSPARSAELAGHTRACVLAMAGTVVDGVTVYQVAENAGPVNLPDPESNQSRHTMTFVVSLRGRAN